MIDGHPATLGWLGAVHGHRTRALGVEHFGQSGSVADLYRHYRHRRQRHPRRGRDDRGGQADPASQGVVGTPDAPSALVTGPLYAVLGGRSRAIANSNNPEPTQAGTAAHSHGSLPVAK